MSQHTPIQRTLTIKMMRNKLISDIQLLLRNFDEYYLNSSQHLPKPQSKKLLQDYLAILKNKNIPFNDLLSDGIYGINLNTQRNNNGREYSCAPMNDGYSTWGGGFCDLATYTFNASPMGNIGDYEELPVCFWFESGTEPTYPDAFPYNTQANNISGTIIDPDTLPCEQFNGNSVPEDTCLQTYGCYWDEDNQYCNNMIPYQTGDINNDSNIDILDVVQMVNVILNSDLLRQLDCEELCAMDPSQDGNVDVLDVVMTVASILDTGSIPYCINTLTETIPGCTDSSACNYNPTANVDDGSCLYNDCAGECGGGAELDECGVCEGDGPEPNFDCDGNCLVDIDCAGVCGGDAFESTWYLDIDQDGICCLDDSTTFTGCSTSAPDGWLEVNECNGQFEEQDECECPHDIDACGVCDGDDSSCTGCMDPIACNYDSAAIIPDNDSCDYYVECPNGSTLNCGVSELSLCPDVEYGNVYVWFDDVDISGETGQIIIKYLNASGVDIPGAQIKSETWINFDENFFIDQSSGGISYTGVVDNDNDIGSLYGFTFSTAPMTLLFFSLQGNIVPHNTQGIIAVVDIDNVPESGIVQPSYESVISDPDGLCFNGSTSQNCEAGFSGQTMILNKPGGSAGDSFGVIEGCMDEDADNYNPNANVDNCSDPSSVPELEEYDFLCGLGSTQCGVNEFGRSLCNLSCEYTNYEPIFTGGDNVELNPLHYLYESQEGETIRISTFVYDENLDGNSIFNHLRFEFLASVGGEIVPFEIEEEESAESGTWFNSQFRIEKINENTPAEFILETEFDITPLNDFNGGICHNYEGNQALCGVPGEAVDCYYTATDGKCRPKIFVGVNDEFGGSTTAIIAPYIDAAEDNPIFVSPNAYDYTEDFEEYYQTLTFQENGEPASVQIIFYDADLIANSEINEGEHLSIVFSGNATTNYDISVDEWTHFTSGGSAGKVSSFLRIQPNGEYFTPLDGSGVDELFVNVVDANGNMTPNPVEINMTTTAVIDAPTSIDFMDFVVSSDQYGEYEEIEIPLICESSTDDGSDQPNIYVIYYPDTYEMKEGGSVFVEFSDGAQYELNDYGDIFYELVDGLPGNLPSSNSHTFVLENGDAEPFDSPFNYDEVDYTYYLKLRYKPRNNWIQYMQSLGLEILPDKIYYTCGTLFDTSVLPFTEENPDFPIYWSSTPTGYEWNVSPNLQYWNTQNYSVPANPIPLTTIEISSTVREYSSGFGVPNVEIEQSLLSSFDAYSGIDLSEDSLFDKICDHVEMKVHPGIGGAVVTYPHIGHLPIPQLDFNDDDLTSTGYPICGGEPNNPASCRAQQTAEKFCKEKVGPNSEVFSFDISGGPYLGDMVFLGQIPAGTEKWSIIEDGGGETLHRMTRIICTGEDVTAPFLDNIWRDASEFGYSNDCQFDYSLAGNLSDLTAIRAVCSDGSTAIIAEQDLLESSVLNYPNEFRYDSGAEACSSQYSNTRLFYDSDADKRPALGCFYYEEDNFSNEEWLVDLPNEDFNRYHKKDFVSNGDASQVEYFRDEIPGTDCYGSARDISCKEFKPNGGWKFINWHGVPSGSIGSLSYESWYDSGYMETGLNQYSGWRFPDTHDDSFFLWAPFVRKVNQEGGDYDGLFGDEFTRAAWVLSPHCKSYDKCLLFGDYKRTPDTQKPVDIGGTYGDSYGQFNAGLTTDGPFYYNSFNQYQRILGTDHNEINPASALKISFWMKTLNRHSNNSPSVEVGIYPDGTGPGGDGYRTNGFATDIGTSNFDSMGYCNFGDNCYVSKQGRYPDQKYVRLGTDKCDSTGFPAWAYAPITWDGGFGDADVYDYYQFDCTREWFIENATHFTSIVNGELSLEQGALPEIGVFCGEDDDLQCEVTWGFTGAYTGNNAAEEVRNWIPTNNGGYFRPIGAYSSIPGNPSHENIHETQPYMSYLGGWGKFENKTLNEWEYFEYIMHIDENYKYSDGSMRRVNLTLQLAKQDILLPSGDILIDDISVTEAYDFIPDCDVRVKQGPNMYSEASLTEYYDPDIDFQKYKESSAPLEASFYFYPRYPISQVFDYDKPIIHNDFRRGSFYIYDIDWGDGTQKEFSTEPKKIGNNVALTHTYTKSGIYEVTGYMLRTKLANDLTSLGVAHNERFTLRINVNEGLDEDFEYFGSDGFSFIPYKNTSAVIGGYSEQSAYYKSIYRQLGFISSSEPPIKVDVPFEKISDKLKTELALMRMESKNSASMDVVTEFNIPRTIVSGSTDPNDIIWTGLNYTTEEMGISVGDFDLADSKYFKQPKQIWEMLGFPEPYNVYWNGGSYQIIPQTFNSLLIDNNATNLDMSKNNILSSSFPTLEDSNKVDGYLEIKVDIGEQTEYYIHNHHGIEITRKDGNIGTTDELSDGIRINENCSQLNGEDGWEWQEGENIIYAYLPDCDWFRDNCLLTEKLNPLFNGSVDCTEFLEEDDCTNPACQWVYQDADGDRTGTCISVERCLDLDENDPQYDFYDQPYDFGRVQIYRNGPSTPECFSESDNLNLINGGSFSDYGQSGGDEHIWNYNGNALIYPSSNESLFGNYSLYYEDLTPSEITPPVEFLSWPNYNFLFEGDTPLIDITQCNYENTTCPNVCGTEMTFSSYLYFTDYIDGHFKFNIRIEYTDGTRQIYEVGYFKHHSGIGGDLEFIDEGYCKKSTTFLTGGSTSVNTTDEDGCIPPPDVFSLNEWHRISYTFTINDNPSSNWGECTEKEISSFIVSMRFNQASWNTFEDIDDDQGFEGAFYLDGVQLNQGSLTPWNGDGLTVNDCPTIDINSFKITPNRESIPIGSEPLYSEYHPGNPNSPRWWKNIVPESFSIPENIYVPWLEEEISDEEAMETRDSTRGSWGFEPYECPSDIDASFCGCTDPYAWNYNPGAIFDCSGNPASCGTGQSPCEYTVVPYGWSGYDDEEEAFLPNPCPNFGESSWDGCGAASCNLIHSGGSPFTSDPRGRPDITNSAIMPYTLDSTFWFNVSLGTSMGGNNHESDWGKSDIRVNYEGTYEGCLIPSLDSNFVPDFTSPTLWGSDIVTTERLCLFLGGMLIIDNEIVWYNYENSHEWIENEGEALEIWNLWDSNLKKGMKIPFTFGKPIQIIELCNCIGSCGMTYIGKPRLEKTMCWDYDYDMPDGINGVCMGYPSTAPGVISSNDWLGENLPFPDGSGAPGQVPMTCSPGFEIGNWDPPCITWDDCNYEITDPGHNQCEMDLLASGNSYPVQDTYHGHYYNPPWDQPEFVSWYGHELPVDWIPTFDRIVITENNCAPGYKPYSFTDGFNNPTSCGCSCVMEEFVDLMEITFQQGSINLPENINYLDWIQLGTMPYSQFGVCAGGFKIPSGVIIENCSEITDEDECNSSLLCEFLPGNTPFECVDVANPSFEWTSVEIVDLEGTPVVDLPNIGDTIDESINCRYPYDGNCPLDSDDTGCMDPPACNYNPIALVDDGSCFYPTPFENLFGTGSEIGLEDEVLSCCNLDEFYECRSVGVSGVTCTGGACYDDLETCQAVCGEDALCIGPHNMGSLTLACLDPAAANCGCDVSIYGYSSDCGGSINEASGEMSVCEECYTNEWSPGLGGPVDPLLYPPCGNAEDCEFENCFGSPIGAIWTCVYTACPDPEACNAHPYIKGTSQPYDEFSSSLFAKIECPESQAIYFTSGGNYTGGDCPSCVYPSLWCLDALGNGLCDPNQEFIYSCTQPGENYIQVTADNQNEIFGCIDPDSPSCTSAECCWQQELSGNYESYPQCCSVDIEEDGSCTTPLLEEQWATYNDGSCYYIPIGCTDQFASNFDPAALQCEDGTQGEGSTCCYYTDGNWIGVNEFGYSYYYPVLPRFNKYGEFDSQNLGLMRDEFGLERIPYGGIHYDGVTWTAEDLVASITNIDVYDNSLVMNITSEQTEKNVLTDKSGNENLGFAFSDYKVDFNSSTSEPGTIKNTDTVKKSRNDGAY